MTKTITKEEDIINRIGGFKDEYSKLLKKYEVDLAVYPVFLPNPNGSFQVGTNAQIVDVKYATASPAEQKAIIEK